MSLEIKNIELYLDKNHILKNLSLEVKDGEFITILGKSGCGKTSLIKSIAGFNEISSGDISIDGDSILNLAPEKRQTVIVFQDLRLFPNMNVEENIAFSMKLRKIPKDKIKKRVYDLLDLVRLSGFEKRKISQLSGGQMQRVALARALGADPKVLLLDEPFSGLDESLRKEMGKLVKGLHKKNGITTIMITHDKEEAMKLSDRIALMQEGKIVQYGSPIDLFTHPKTKSIAEFMGEVNYFYGININNKFICEFGEFDIEDGMAEYGLLLRPSQLNVYKKKGGIYRLKDVLYKGEYVTLVLKKDKDYLVNMSYEEFKSLNFDRDLEYSLSIKANVTNPVILKE